MTITEPTGPGPVAATTAVEDEAPSVTAVTYQRVSTKEQASKGGRDEGVLHPGSA